MVSLVNSFVSEDFQLSLASKGVDVDRAIAAINEVEREMVLSAKVRIDGFVAPAVTSANDDDAVTIERNKSKVKSILVSMFIGSLCLIALIMTFGTTFRHQAGEPMDTSWLKPLIDAAISILQSM